MVTEINLPAAQLQIAMGIPLHRIRDIRVLYNEDPLGDSLIDFDNPREVPEPRGAVIACRITAENPDDGFKPSSGQIQELNFRSSRNVWGYFSVGVSGGLHEFADSQFGHCFAWGETRDRARGSVIYTSLLVNLILMPKCNSVLQTRMVFQPEVRPNLSENCHFSTLFRTPKSPKTFGHSPVN